MKIIIINISLLLLSILCLSQAYSQEVMTVEQYLEQVQSRNPEIKEVDLSIQANSQKILELEMIYSPLLTAGYNYIDDRGGAGFGSSLPLDKMTSNAWNIGASKKFKTGSNISLGYSSSDSEISLVEPTAIIGDNKISGFTGYEIKPFIRVDQSLLRDFNGLTEVGIQKAKATARSGQYLQLFRKQQTLLSAKTAYWNLSLARDVVAFRKISLERTAKLLSWNEQKYNLDLVEEGDLLQSQAAHKLRQLNLEQAFADEIKASRDFNEMLGDSSEVVNVAVEKLADRENDYASLDTLTRFGQRADVLAARAKYESSKFADQETYYRSLPEISAFGQYSLHGLGLQYSNAWNQVANSDKPAYMLGLSLIVPLDYKTLRKVREGYKNDFNAAQQAFNRSELAAKNGWEQLLNNWSNVRTRLKLAREIQTIQEKRVANEQSRLERGRSTTFQVLTAENDLDEAILNVYRLVFEELMTSAQAELYNTKL